MSQTTEAFQESVPFAAPTDSESVRTCLDAAQALWKKGEHREAVRWLQRGAAAAEEAGDDDRALSIARRAADLASRVGPPSQRAPDSADPSRTHSSAPPPSVQPAAQAAAQAAARAAAQAAAARPSAAPVVVASQSELIAQGRAVRVAVKRSALDDALYVVRPLGAKLGAGAREALLILSEPDPTFFAVDSVKTPAGAQ